MTKEDLITMGMSEEVAGACLAAFQNELRKESKTEKSTQAEASLQKEIANLQQQLKDNDSAHKKAVHEMKLETAIEKALTGANAIHQKAVRPFLEGLDKAEFLEDGTVKGLAEQLKDLTENTETSFLFQTSEPQKADEKPPVRGVNVGASSPSIAPEKLDLATMGYTAYNEAMLQMENQ